MAVESTDFRIYTSIFSHIGFGSTNVQNINAVGAGTQNTANVGGVGPGDQLILNFSANQFDIPAGSTIVGFKTRIRADRNNGQTPVNVKYTFANGEEDPDAIVTGYTFDDSISNTRTITTEAFTTYNSGYGVGSDNNFLDDGVLDLWNNQGIAKLKVEFLNSNPSADDGFMAVFFNSFNNTECIGLQVFYEPPTPTKVILKSHGPLNETRGADVFIANGSSPTNGNQLTTSADGSAVASFSSADHTTFSYFQISNFGFNIPLGSIVNSVQFDINVDRASFPNNGNFQLSYWFTNGGALTLKRNSPVYTVGQNHVTDSNIYINSENNNFFTPAVLNNLAILIFWPVEYDMTGNTFTDSITGQNPSTPVFSETQGSVFIGGSPNSNNDDSPDSNGYPKITVNYNAPTKIKIQDYLLDHIGTKIKIQSI